MATSTASNTVIQSEDSSTFGKLLKELERKLCFTDVPCGAMEFQKEAPVEATAKEGTGWFRHLENALCFSDLKDLDGQITEKDLERIETMKSLVDNDDCTYKDTAPAKALMDDAGRDPAEDTDSCTDSDESKPTDNESKPDETPVESHGIELKVKPELLNDSMEHMVLSAVSEEEKMPGQIELHEFDKEPKDDKDDDDEDGRSVGSASAEMSAVTLPSFMLFTPLRKKSKKNIRSEPEIQRRSLKASIDKFAKRAMRSRASILKLSKERNFDSKDLDTTERATGSSKRWAFRKSNTMATF